MSDLDQLLDHAVAEAARTYVARYVEFQGATGTTIAEVRIALDWALHELLVVTGSPCGCDPGTCPADLEVVRRPSFGHCGRGDRLDVDPAYL